MEHYNGNNAYRVRLKEREERKLISRENPGYESFVRAKRKEIIGSILIIMAVALMIILRYAQISVLNSDVQSTKKALEEARAEYTNLEIERDRIIDLSHVEDVAVNSYGMTTPTKDQIVYISVERGDCIKVAKSGGGASLFWGQSAFN